MEFSKILFLQRAKSSHKTEGELYAIRNMLKIHRKTRRGKKKKPSDITKYNVKTDGNLVPRSTK